jgi:hypothetical protein
METVKPQLHQSSLDMLFKCGEQYYRRYILGEKIPPGIALVVGSATHKSIEKNLTAKIKTGELLSVEQVKDVARDELEGMWKSGIRLDEEELKRGIQAIKGEAIDIAVSLSTLHRTDLAPILAPTHVERKFVVKLDGYPMDLSGTIDIQEGAKRIRDTKTAAKSPSQGDADSSLQLTMYGLAAKVVDGVAPQEFALDGLVKTKTPKVVTLKTTRTDEDYQMLLRRVERSIAIIEKGAFTPARPTDWWCSRKWCGYWDSCPFAARPVSVSMDQ